ncbi:MAG: LytR C-terminal domain-containing protein [Elusimicrobiota bacterium]
MEYPRRALIVERCLAAALLAAALATAGVESRSTFAVSARAGRPWLAWIAARERGAASAPFLHLAIYEPSRRRLAVVHVPGDLKLEGRRTLERAYFDAFQETGDAGAAARAAEDLAEARLRELSPEPIPAISARLAVEIAPTSPEDEPALETARELKARGRRFRTWPALARRAAAGAPSGDGAAADALFFALDLRRAPEENAVPARLPVDDSAAELLGRLLAAENLPSDGRATTVEVLNGAGEAGLASRAAKVLRSRGVDVLATGGVPPRARTLVYDRVGNFARAAGARAALGCPSARTITRLDASRAVDASVELGADCAGSFSAGGVRQP